MQGLAEPNNRLIAENRIGRFSMSRSLLYKSDHAGVCALFGTMIVVRAEADFPRDTIDYIAYSALFPSIDMNRKPPEYHIYVTETDTEESPWAFTVEDRTDAWNAAGVTFTYLKCEEL